MEDIKFIQALTSFGALCGWHSWGFIDGAFISPAESCEQSVAGAKKHSYQYIGFCDRNKVEIYDGSRLRSDLNKKRPVDGTVRWHSNDAAYYVHWDDGQVTYFRSGYGIVDDIEVIGHIEENIELTQEPPTSSNSSEAKS